MSKKTTDYLNNQLIEKYRSALDGEIIKRSLPDFLDWLTDEYRQHIEIVKMQQDRIKELEERLAEKETQIDCYAPVEIAQRALTGTNADQHVEARETSGERMLSIRQDNACYASVTFTIREEPKHEGDYPILHTIRRWGLFPGTIEQAKHEIGERLILLLHRAPLRENLHAKSIPGVSDEDMLEAMIDVAKWWFIKEVQTDENGNYWNRLKETYDYHIKPHVVFNDKVCTDEAAYDRWRKTVTDSFNHMMDKGRGKVEPPRIRYPKKRKQEVTYTRTVLRPNPS